MFRLSGSGVIASPLLELAQTSEHAGRVVRADGRVVLIDMRIGEHLVTLNGEQALSGRQQRALQRETGLVELCGLDPKPPSKFMHDNTNSTALATFIALNLS